MVTLRTTFDHRFYTIGLDEKAFRKGYSYFTLVNDLVTAPVLHVAEGRQQASLDGFWETLTEEQNRA